MSLSQPLNSEFDTSSDPKNSPLISVWFTTGPVIVYGAAVARTAGPVLFSNVEWKIRKRGPIKTGASDSLKWDLTIWVEYRLANNGAVVLEAKRAKIVKFIELFECD